MQAQSRYTRLEAEKLIFSDAASLGWTDRVRRWRVVAPPAMLLYCLIIRRGLFDGWAGFYYAFQRALAELMLSLYLIDHDLRISDCEFRIAEFESEKPHRGDAENAEVAQRNPQFEVRNSKF